MVKGQDRPRTEIPGERYASGLAPESDEPRPLLGRGDPHGARLAASRALFQILRGLCQHPSLESPVAGTGDERPAPVPGLVIPGRPVLRDVPA